VSWATAGVDPSVMGSGPIPASRKALERAGWTTDDLDLIEANEAFAVQAIADARELAATSLVSSSADEVLRPVVVVIVAKLFDLPRKLLDPFDKLFALGRPILLFFFGVGDSEWKHNQGEQEHGHTI